jgi:hypothetical protein
VDWDADGDLDLILGSHGGNFFLRWNEGSSTKPAFATKSIILTNENVALEIPGHDAVPAIADWDSDGRFDILSGSGTGGAYWLRNIGTKEKPAFAKPEVMLQSTDASADSVHPTWPGSRTQVCATDYDRDGDLDLLVGDYNSQNGKMHGWIWLFRRR